MTSRQDPQTVPRRGMTVLVIAFFVFAGVAVAATATALVTLIQERSYSAVAVASFLLVCGVNFVLGVLFAVAGRGASRLLLAFALLALGFGAVHAWADFPLLTSVLTPAGLIGFFWILASFPGVRPRPGWLRWAVVWLAVWACVCFGIPSVRDAIDSGVDPWNVLVGPGFLTGLVVIVAGKAIDFRHTDRATRRWYLILGVAVVLSMIGGGISAALTASGHFALGNGVDEASTLFGNLSTAAILAILGAAAISEGYYGVVVTDEQRRKAWRTMFPEDPAPESVPFDLEGLTYREKQLLPLLASGTSTTAMAKRLGISEKTVRNYLTNLYAKLGASDRATGALAARDAITPNERTTRSVTALGDAGELSPE